MKKLLAAVTALALLVCSAAAPASQIAAESVCTPVGMDISGFSTLDFDQNHVDGSIFHHAALTVINFWETCCGPCISEMPYFQQAHDHYSATPEADVQVYTVLYVGESSTVPEAITLLQDYSFGKLIMDDVLAEAFYATEIFPGMLAFPETILVDSNGIVRYHHFAIYQNYNELNSEIQQWLAQVPPVTPTEPPAPAADGDADGNGTINVADALLCLRAAMGLLSFTEEQIARCDMDANGGIAISDALTILRSAMGLLND
ncbi:MAG: redoxin domain-containing protein [Clostridia bacterium]|nr:redoxin domain-containing protein [Clostridia bacterium]